MQDIAFYYPLPPTQAVVPTDSDWRQKLFDYMDKEHDVQLLDSDMNEIQHICFPPDYPYVVSPVKQEAEDADICDILFKFYHETEITSNKDDLKYVYEKYVKAIRYLNTPVNLIPDGYIYNGQVFDTDSIVLEDIIKRGAVPFYFSKPIVKDWDEVKETRGNDR